MSRDHRSRRLAVRAHVAGLAMLVVCAAAHAQGFRAPSQEGPGGSVLRSVDSVGGIGGAPSSAAAYGSRGPTGVATASAGGFQSAAAGYYASSPSAGGARSYSSGGSLISPIGGLSSYGTDYASIGRGSGSALPLAIGHLRGQSASVPSYMPFSGREVGIGMDQLAVPRAQTDLDADLPPEQQGQLELGEVMRQQIILRYARLVERGWTQFRGEDFQAALHAFRSVEELSRDLMQRESRAAQGVNHGMMLAYMADQAYSAAGQQMVVLLRRDPLLFDLSRREILKNYSDIELFRRHRLELREHVASGTAEPGTALALCYCVWLDGNTREAVDMARSFARQVQPAQAQPYYDFVRKAEGRAAAAS